MNLDISPGALVGLVGLGASLLAEVLGGLVEPDEGQVLLDGVALPQLERHELREAIGYAATAPALFGHTVADAITFGGLRPDERELVAAARQAQADDFIRRLPRGYETPLADTPMSGGERQRLGLARTFAHPGRVLILDDVVGSLDTVTEHLIREVLTGSFAGRTRLVVARRASTAAATDTVVWLHDGHVRAVDTHDRLWAEEDYRAVFEVRA